MVHGAMRLSASIMAGMDGQWDLMTLSKLKTSRLAKTGLC